MKKIISLLLAVAMSAAVMTGCAGNAGSGSSGEKLVFAYQQGIAYLPAVIMQDQKLIEKYYNEATGKEVTVEFKKFDAGSVINEGVLAGTIDAGCMGLAPFITAVMKNTPYKAYSAISSQATGLVTWESRLKSLKDFKEGDKISVPNKASIQYIMLAMACKKELGDPRALDKNVTELSHVDGFTSLINKSLAAQLTSAPYINKALETEGYFEIEDVKNAVPKDMTFICGVATNKLYDEKPELYNALVKATEEAMKYINANKEAVAEQVYQNEGVTKEKMLEYLNDERCVYTTELGALMETANFMADNGFIDKKPNDMSEIVFSNVKGN